LSYQDSVDHRDLPSFPTRRSSDLRITRVTLRDVAASMISAISGWTVGSPPESMSASIRPPSRSIAVSSDRRMCGSRAWRLTPGRSEEHTSELQSLRHLVCRLLLEK